MKKLICVMLSVSLMLLATSCNFLVKNDDQEQFDYPVTVGNLVFEKAPDGVVVLSDNLADIILANILDKVIETGAYAVTLYP